MRKEHKQAHPDFQREPKREMPQLSGNHLPEDELLTASLCLTNKMLFYVDIPEGWEKMRLCFCLFFHKAEN